MSQAACRLDPASAEDIFGKHYVSTTTLVDADEALSAVRRALVRRGWRVVAGAGRLSAVRGRFTPLATILFHAALFFLPIGIIVGSLGTVRAEMALAEGESFSGAVQEYAQLSPKKSLLRLPSIDFRVVKVRPRFWRDQLLFTDLLPISSFRPESREGKRESV